MQALTSLSFQGEYNFERHIRIYYIASIICGLFGSVRMKTKTQYLISASLCAWTYMSDEHMAEGNSSTHYMYSRDTKHFSVYHHKLILMQIDKKCSCLSHVYLGASLPHSRLAKSQNFIPANKL